MIPVARLILPLSALLVPAPAGAQMLAHAAAEDAVLATAIDRKAVLPDAPSALLAPVAVAVSNDADGPAEEQVASATSQVMAKKHATTIQPGQTAQPLSAGDKFAIGIDKQLTLGAFASWNVSAGYKHLVNNRPHYGTDRAGFGERLGASALRDTSQSILYYGIFSNLLREDPRYYVLGPQHKVVDRALYAASRVVITRKDSGGTTGNYSLISAVFCASALTNAYYPDRDISAGKTITGALTTLAIRAGTQQLREFSGELKRAVHLKH